MAKLNVYERVTNQILEMMEEGHVPWQKPWNPSKNTPINLKSGKAYRGINTWLLMNPKFKSQYWATFKQITEMKGKVKKGSKSSLVVYWNQMRVTKEDKNGEEKVNHIPFLKFFLVFNLDQVEGIEVPENQPELFEDIQEAEAIYKNMPEPPKLDHRAQDKAFYRPSTDQVVMPEKEQFNSREEYYSTLFHELSHSTGHEIRLKRKGITDKNMFGSHEYSKEELVAELSSSFLRAMTGIECESTMKNSAAYIKSWMKALKEDEKLFVYAAAQATKAANYIMNIKYEEEK